MRSAIASASSHRCKECNLPISCFVGMLSKESFGNTGIRRRFIQFSIEDLTSAI
jgi:hypothetical protein